jgi:hypothetical protein
LEQVSRVVPNDAANILLVEDDHTRAASSRGYTIRRRDSVHFVFHVDETPYFEANAHYRQPVIVPDTVLTRFGSPRQARRGCALMLRRFIRVQTDDRFPQRR